MEQVYVRRVSMYRYEICAKRKRVGCSVHSPFDLAGNMLLMPATAVVG